MENIEPVDISYKDLGGNIKDLNVYPKKVYNYWTQNIENLLHQLAVGFDKLESDGHLAMIDLYNILYMNSNKYIKGIPSSEPRSLKEYYNSKTFVLETFSYSFIYFLKYYTKNETRKLFGLKMMNFNMILLLL